MPRRVAHRACTCSCAFARVSGRVAKRWGDAGSPGRLRFDVHGAGGQSFGAFLCAGVDISLTGEANDYIGKSMAGGVISIRPPPDAGCASATAAAAPRLLSVCALARTVLQ